MDDTLNRYAFKKVEESKKIQELLFKYPIEIKHIEVLGKFLEKNYYDGDVFKIFLEDVSGLRL
jgi:hypothetical protein